MNTINILKSVIVSIAVLGSAHMLSSAVRTTFGRENVIEVKGYAERKVQADLAKWAIIFRAEDKDLSAAYQKLSGYEKKILELLEANKISKSTVQMGRTYTQYFRKKHVNAQGVVEETNETDRYSAEKTIVVELKDVEKVTEVANKLDELIGQGVNVRTESLKYFCTNLEALKIELIGEATNNAYTRAQQLAKATGSRVGALRSARQGIFQVTAENSSDTSDYGVYDTNDIRKNVKVVTNITFGIG